MVHLWPISAFRSYLCRLYEGSGLNQGGFGILPALSEIVNRSYEDVHKNGGPVTMW